MMLQDHLVRIWLTEQRTVLYVTHDIGEAVYLADRIVILQPSPGRLASDLPRPRNRHLVEFLRMKAWIMEEMRHHDVATE